MWNLKHDGIMGRRFYSLNFILFVNEIDRKYAEVSVLPTNQYMVHQYTEPVISSTSSNLYNLCCPNPVMWLILISQICRVQI